MAHEALPFDVGTVEAEPHVGAPETPHAGEPTAHLNPRLSPVVPGASPVASRALHSAPLYVRHPRARRYVVRVKSDGTVRVTIPRWGTKREAMAFAEQQRAWIAKQLTRVERERQAAPQETPPEEQRALRARAQRELPPRLLALAQAFELTVAGVSIRNQRWRWGSCSRSGHICLNWRLVAMPEWVRDYVLIHELMHLKRMDHSPTFWKLVAAAGPGCRDARRWLRTHQSLLDSRS